MFRQHDWKTIATIIYFKLPFRREAIYSDPHYDEAPPEYEGFSAPGGAASSAAAPAVAEAPKEPPKEERAASKEDVVWARGEVGKALGFWD